MKLFPMTKDEFLNISPVLYHVCGNKLYASGPTHGEVSNPYFDALRDAIEFCSKARDTHLYFGKSC